MLNASSAHFDPQEKQRQFWIAAAQTNPTPYSAARSFLILSAALQAT
jgi:hypothetical protein